MELFGQLHKQAIIVEDMPGFVSNRISHLFMNEAAFVLQDQVSTAEDIDCIFKQCFGHKMGPLETADLIGLDTVANSLDVLYESFQDPGPSLLSAPAKTRGRRPPRPPIRPGLLPLS